MCALVAVGLHGAACKSADARRPAGLPGILALGERLEVDETNTASSNDANAKDAIVGELHRGLHSGARHRRQARVRGSCHREGEHRERLLVVRLRTAMRQNLGGSAPQ